MGFTYQIRAQFTAVTIALSAVLFGFAGAANAAAVLTATCNNVSINGTIWTMTGYWSLSNMGGTQVSAYDLAIYSPSGTLADDSSRDTPDTFAATTTNPSAKTAAGTWSNQIDFGATNPATIVAQLYHAQPPGHEASDTSACTFTLPTRLTLHKTVVNDDFGGAHNTDWTLTATGPTAISGIDGTAAVTNAVVTAGTYTLGETGGPTGYTNGTYSCVRNGGAAVVSNTITLAAGDNAVCTVTNNDVAGATVTITKTAVGGDGIFSFFGSGGIGAFTITTSGGTGSKPFTVNPFTGPYTITETDPAPAWDITADTCAGLAVSSGGTTNCGITNTKRGSITVHKDVVAPDGTTNVSDTHGFTATLDDANPHAVSESASYTYANLVPGHLHGR